MGNPSFKISIEPRPDHLVEEKLRADISLLLKDAGYTFAREMIGTKDDDRVTVFRHE